MIKFSLHIFLLALLISSSQATFKKRKGSKKGEDTAAQGTSHGARPAQPEGHHHSGDYQNGGGYPSQGGEGPQPYRGETHSQGYHSPRPHPQSNNGYRGGDEDYDGYRREPSHHHHHNHEPEGEGYRSPPRVPGGYRREPEAYHGEPSNHGINYNRGEPYRNFQNMHAGPQHTPGGYRQGGGPPRTNYRGGPNNDDDDKRRYGPGGAEYENSDEEDDRQGLGWVGIHGTTSHDGSTKANQTEGTGTGRLGSFFSRTRSGIKRLLKLS